MFLLYIYLHWQFSAQYNPIHPYVCITIQWDSDCSYCCKGLAVEADRDYVDFTALKCLHVQ